MNEFIYFRSVPGKLVTRFGSKSLIGASIECTAVEHKGRFTQTITEPRWSDDVTAIPSTEIARYRREYTRCIREGSLIQVDPTAPAKLSKKTPKE